MILFGKKIYEFIINYYHTLKWVKSTKNILFIWSPKNVTTQVHIGFIATYAISAYHHKCCEFESTHDEI